MNSFKKMPTLDNLLLFFSLNASPQQNNKEETLVSQSQSNKVNNHRSIIICKLLFERIKINYLYY